LHSLILYSAKALMHFSYFLLWRGRVWKRCLESVFLFGYVYSNVVLKIGKEAWNVQYSTHYYEAINTQRKQSHEQNFEIAIYY
jgi:hypothetical protein